MEGEERKGRRDRREDRVKGTGVGEKEGKGRRGGEIEEKGRRR